MHILVLRFSAFGDVAILQPVLRQRAAANPDVHFTLAAPKRAQPLFDGIPNVDFLPIDKHKPLREIWQTLYATRPDVVADMHGVLRTYALDSLFRMRGVPVHTIDKERVSRKRLLREKNKDLTPLKPSWRRYDEVFNSIGLAGKTEQQGFVCTHLSDDGLRRIGIAPFAQHAGKVWPMENVARLIELLAQQAENRIFLFGGRDEVEALRSLAAPYGPLVQVCAGMGSLADEMEMMRSLNVLLSMDSANMHIDSCLGVPVVSIWGATHPSAGFYGWRQRPEWALQADMPCRPCSMFGNKPCRFGDYRCLKAITPEQVAKKLLEF